MNDEWIDQLLAEPVDVEPRPGFRKELRDRLAAEFATPAMASGPVGDRRPRRWMLGAVAASAVLLAGVLALTRNGDLTVDATDGPSPTGVEIDSSAISLDEWIDPVAAGPVDPSVVAIDRTNLPEGWSVSGESGLLIAYPTDVNGYTYEAVVTIDDDSAFSVTLIRDPVANDPCFIPLAGFEGTIGDLTGATPSEAVCGTTADGAGLAVAPTPESSTNSSPSALDVANTLTFSSVDEIPHRDLTIENGGDEPVDLDLHGTLSGVRWAVDASTVQIDLYVAGTKSSGMGLSASDSAFPVQGSIDGVPGYGAIAYGRLFGDAVTVTATADDGRTASLPLVSIRDWSLFAVPLPDTVDIATLTFLAADQSVVAIVDVPDIPSGYEGGILNLVPRD